MNTSRLLRRAALGLLGIGIAATIAFCTLGEERPGPSSDLAALRQVVAIPEGVTSARWEIFGTPEYTGGVPGPTDYMTLVAELDLADDTAFEADAPSHWPPSVVPEAPRPWLSAAFRDRLERSRNKELDIAGEASCRPVRSRMSKSDRVVPGFACRAAGKTLLYLELLGPSD